ncbi:MAG TPA: nuclear transport factor 2 family protein [Burkholderiales bacterium]|nr:nuclear transport factor 2 family protein [Burkholderiales bacterium]
MTVKIFATPEDAEAAFYEALEHADLDAMMSVWAEDEDIVCVHPGGPRLAGFDEVRDSWREIFANGPNLHFQLTGQQYLRGVRIAVHSLHENVVVSGQSQPVSPIVATNIYIQTDRGWRMLVHHASPAVRELARAEETPPTVLH